MKLSDYLVEEIFRTTKTSKVFGYIGGMIAHIVDSIYLNDNVEMVNTITEQGAGFAAEGYSRTTGKTGVAIATSGPGATNLVTPIANCYFDSSPVLFITGQVNTYEYKKYDIKQCGFQETNIIDVVRPICKYAKMITDAKDIKYELHKALHIANSGRKGPVVLDIPMNIQREEIDVDNLKDFYPEEIKTNKNFNNFDISILHNAKKPLILAGNGINLSGCKKELDTLLRKHNIPIVESLLGIDTVLSDYKYNMGLIGTYGNRYGNLAFYDCDVLIVLGSRLDIRQTGANCDFMQNKTIIHVDVDSSELECSKFNKIKIEADVKDFISYLLQQDIVLNISDWHNICINLKETFPNEKKLYKLPNEVMSKIFDNLEQNVNITCDVGQNQVWAAQSANIKNGQRMFSSGGHGCMGFALPAAIGSSITGNKSVVITGDGGMQMNIQELEIIKRRNLPIKIFVFNNKSLGMVRSFQELYFNSRCASTVEDYSAPNFAKIANAYDIESLTINAADFTKENIKELLTNNKPFLFNIMFDTNTQVEPRIEFGNPINRANPIIDENIINEVLKH